MGYNLLLFPSLDPENLYNYCDKDIDTLSKRLRIKWEESKTTAFTSLVVYLGFLWDLDSCMVAVPDQKRAKYLAAIESWEAQSRHTLIEVQKLYGKLLHTILIVPEDEHTLQAWRPCWDRSITALSSLTPHPETLQAILNGGR